MQASLPTLSSVDAKTFGHHQQTRFSSKYLEEIKAIMYTYGDVFETDPEAAALIEEIVREELAALVTMHTH